MSGLDCHMASPLGTGGMGERVSVITHAKSTGINPNVTCTKKNKSGSTSVFRHLKDKVKN